MTELATAFASIFSSAGGAAAGTAGATAGAAAGSGLLNTLLQGTASVLGMAQAVSAGKQEAEAAELAALDAEREMPLEMLQGINRRADIKRAMMDSIGQQDVAYAASGTDLSFGTPGQARRDAFRQADFARETDIGNEQTRIARLDERAANYRKRAARARSSGLFDALTIGVSGASKIAERY